MAYRTAQKESLMAFLRQHTDKAFTVEEIAAAMDGENTPGKSTLYRLITHLVEDGSVKRFVRGNSRQFVYQAVGCSHCDAHLHMKCVDCGRILHLDDAASDKVLQNILRASDFAVDEQQTVLFGRCAGCKRKDI